MKFVSRCIWVIILIHFSEQFPVLAQDIGARKSIDSTDFYVFTEAGGQYVPSIQFNNSSINGIPIDLDLGSGSTYSGSYSVNLSNIVAQPSVGYDFVLGFGYQINKNLGIELEIGYASTSLGTTSFSINSSSTGTGSISGTPFTNGTTSGSGTGSLTGSSINLISVPILIGVCVQERSEKFQPIASIGLGVCPSIIRSDNLSISWNDTGTFASSAGSGSYSILSYSEAGGSVTTQTAYPFAFKFKAGFDYALSNIASVGIRAWAMGLANSNFGDDLQSDLYGAVGLNGSLKFRF